HRVRAARSEPGGGAARPGPHGGPPGRAPCPRRVSRGLVRRPIPQPTVRPALDHGPLAGGRVPPRKGAEMTITNRLVKDVPADAAVLGVPVFEGERSGPGAELA